MAFDRVLKAFHCLHASIVTNFLSVVEVASFFGLVVVDLTTATAAAVVVVFVVVFFLPTVFVALAGTFVLGSPTPLVRTIANFKASQRYVCETKMYCIFRWHRNEEVPCLTSVVSQKHASPPSSQRWFSKILYVQGRKGVISWSEWSNLDPLFDSQKIWGSPLPPLVMVFRMVSTPFYLFSKKNIYSGENFVEYPFLERRETSIYRIV